ncbi:hypothetical protein ACFUN7_18430 [Streptomyces sp. NPDC057236]|uniref:hypothetical protein n=1 Tax=Streptomyces sp. NPDC057236 TaxID=3346059 RepID=UPI003637238E
MGGDFRRHPVDLGQEPRGEDLVLHGIVPDPEGLQRADDGPALRVPRRPAGTPIGSTTAPPAPCTSR